MTNEEIAKLRDLAAKATPGPWRIHDCGHRSGKYDADRSCGIDEARTQTVPWSSEPQPVEVFGSDNIDQCSHPIGMADAAFIAAFNPETATALLDELERLRENFRVAILIIDRAKELVGAVTGEPLVDAIRRAREATR